MARRYISIFAKDPANRVVGGDNVDVRFYNGRSDTLATAFLSTDEADATTLTLPLRAYPRLPTRHVTTEPLTTATDIEVDSTEGWVQGDVIRFNSGGTQAERAIKTVTDATHIELDEAIGFAFPVGSAIRGQVGHARIAVEDTRDYSSDVENVGEGWRSLRVDHAVARTGAILEFQDEGVQVGQRPRLNFTGAGVTATDDSPNDRVNVRVHRDDLWTAGVL